jgi:hypothetical protein
MQFTILLPLDTDKIVLDSRIDGLCSMIPSQMFLLLQLVRQDLDYLNLPAAPLHIRIVIKHNYYHDMRFICKICYY